MKSKEKNNEATKGYLFQKKNKVSVWVSQHPYADIPDEYFEETFYKNNTRAKNTWSENFKIRYFSPEYLETNGAMTGTVNIKQAVSECSYADSYIDVLMSKAKKKKLQEVTWVILLFEYEYSAKISGIEKDKYVTLLGAFNYDAEEDFDKE
ncbi:MAG: immunity 22 family protein [Alcanivoracaceae bacterium]|nr:immunity 22 family protein [Alcanivoracaceae bacterium]